MTVSCMLKSEISQEIPRPRINTRVKPDVINRENTCLSVASKLRKTLYVQHLQSCLYSIMWSGIVSKTRSFHKVLHVSLFHMTTQVVDCTRSSSSMTYLVVLSLAGVHFVCSTGLKGD